jgi:predicted lipid-binding transport protein (Tim44 family)
MTLRKRISLLLAALILGMAATLVAFDDADARRGGGFGSRGGRTYQAPPPTQTAPGPAQPIEKSMTPRTQQGEPAAAARQPTAPQPGLFGSGFAGSMLRGLMLGGLIGLLLGHGLGGLAGLLGLILQLGLVALAVMLVMHFLGRARQPVAAGAGAPFRGNPLSRDNAGEPLGGRGLPAGALGRERALGGSGARPPASAGHGHDEIGIEQRDLDVFERLLGEIQAAFGREDYDALRERTTSEMMSYLAEELGQNATRGLRNDVSDVKLLQGDLAEAWREGGTDYATVAMRYESRDVMRERTTNRVSAGDPDRPTETTEIWTFARPRGGDWRLSAIQDA